MYKFLLIIFFISFSSFARDNIYVATKCFSDMKNPIFKPKLERPYKVKNISKWRNYEHYYYLYEENTCFVIAAYNENGGLVTKSSKYKREIPDLPTEHIKGNGWKGNKKRIYDIFSPFFALDDFIVIFSFDHLSSGTYEMVLDVDVKKRKFDVEEGTPICLDLRGEESDASYNTKINRKFEVTKDGKQTLFINLREFIKDWKIDEFSIYAQVINSKKISIKEVVIEQYKFPWCQGAEYRREVKERQKNFYTPLEVREKKIIPN